jgi:hypothetical protein
VRELLRSSSGRPRPPRGRAGARLGASALGLDGGSAAARDREPEGANARSGRRARPGGRASSPKVHRADHGLDATVGIKLSKDEYDSLSALAAGAGLSVSAYVRKALNLGADAGSMNDQLEDHARRLARLEELVVAFGLAPRSGRPPWTSGAPSRATGRRRGS